MAKCLQYNLHYPSFGASRRHFSLKQMTFFSRYWTVSWDFIANPSIVWFSWHCGAGMPFLIPMFYRRKMVWMIGRLSSCCVELKGTMHQRVGNESLYDQTVYYTIYTTTSIKPSLVTWYFLWNLSLRVGHVNQWQTLVAYLQPLVCLVKLIYNLIYSKIITFLFAKCPTGS